MHELENEMISDACRGEWQINVRTPVSLEGFCSLASIIKAATYPDAFPANHERFWILHRDLQVSLRQNRPEWIYGDRLYVTFPGGQKVVSVDLRNTQFIGADRSVPVFRAGYEPDIGICVDACVPDHGTLWDVGSNWGYFGLFVASRPGFSGEVWAFEPFPASFASLDSVISQLELHDSIKPLQLAVGDSETVVSMSDSLYTGNNAVEGLGSDIQVQQCSLDQISRSRDIKRCDFIKIDVEGAEPAVIRGAQETIQKFRPPIMFEDWHERPVGSPVETMVEIEKLDCGYKFYCLLLKEVSSDQDENSMSMRMMLQLCELSHDNRHLFEKRINIIAFSEADGRSALPNVIEAYAKSQNL